MDLEVLMITEEQHRIHFYANMSARRFKRFWCLVLHGRPSLLVWYDIHVSIP